MIFMETMLHGSHHLSFELRRHFLPGPRYLTGSALAPRRKGLAVQGPTVFSGGEDMSRGLGPEGKVAGSPQKD